MPGMLGIGALAAEVPATGDLVVAAAALVLVALGLCGTANAPIASKAMRV
jgi:hypothetical protein